MKYPLTTCLVSILLIVLSLNGEAQKVDNSITEARNSINVYIGLVDGNINYERNIIQRSKSHSNLRIGFGYTVFLNYDGGTYISPSFVHLIGERNSHLEIDLGIKLILINDLPDPDFSQTFIPDIFLGYRYEKSSGGFTFRIGLNYPTVINLGVGYKF